MIFALTVTQEVISQLISASIILFLSILIFAQHWLRKLRHLLFVGLCLLSLGITIFLNGLAVLFLQPEFLIFRNYLYSAIGLFIVIFFDSITRDSTDPVKLSITVGLSVALVIYSSDPSTVAYAPFWNGDPSYMNVGLEIQIVKFGILAWIAVIAATAYVRVYMHSPKQFRKYILLSLCGILIIGPGGIALALFVEVHLPGILAWSQLCGAIAFALGVSLKSNLAFVLPFRALRLTVISTNAGVPLFTYTWQKDTQLVDEILFSGMIQGVSGILKESVAGGDMEEIKLSNAVLILQPAKDAKIACVLASTKTSRILRGALKQFLDRFLSSFTNELMDHSKVSQFDRASELVAQTFPFIPNYD